MEHFFVPVQQVILSIMNFAVVNRLCCGRFENIHCTRPNGRKWLRSFVGKFDAEFSIIVAIIHISCCYRDIARQQPAMNVNWLNVKGLADVQQVLVESVIMPLKHPGMFVGAMRPWKCILMHGPPGTGKTLLAKALAAETYGKVTFFNVASSTITSKWRGDSEKFIRVLFELAKFYAPSVLFVDEIDGLASKRDAPTDHEASKRFKNEFLTQIDGLDDTNDTVFLLASTNLPWYL